MGGQSSSSGSVIRRREGQTPVCRESERGQAAVMKRPAPLCGVAIHWGWKPSNRNQIVQLTGRADSSAYAFFQ